VAAAQQNLRVDDDGLPCPEVRGWAETKYRLLALYDELFSTGMKYKWERRITSTCTLALGPSRHFVGSKKRRRRRKFPTRASVLSPL
jgi:hypothetical protein